MVKNLTIAALLGSLIWFGMALVQVENERYALELEMCGTLKVERTLERRRCLDEVETRTSASWHLIYALGIL